MEKKRIWLLSLLLVLCTWLLLVLCTWPAGTVTSRQKKMGIIAEVEKEMGTVAVEENENKQGDQKR